MLQFVVFSLGSLLLGIQFVGSGSTPWVGKDSEAFTVASAPDKTLVGQGRTSVMKPEASEHARASYLHTHENSVAVFPPVITRDDAQRLREIVDRRWRNVGLEHVRQLAKEGGDADNLVENTDLEPTYSVDVFADGRCTAGDVNEVDQFTISEDCHFVWKLLQEHINPVVEQVKREWTARGASDFPETLYVCDSFVKRYLPGERSSLHAHKDRYSVMTANVLLSDLEDFQGGLAMFPDADDLDYETLQEQRGLLDEDNVGQPVFLEQGPDVVMGELVLHRGSLWHGVQMLQRDRSQRYTWITWYSGWEDDCSQSLWSPNSSGKKS
eukprot:TRINITY_DN121238_c0_g1_i1.p1 TRINITY_DN121238_c0_g1~~TRINITY_DN121238_c0_g1_i1.p1  ORF type:complete len:325 (+),score=21.73 TRINITY_DN121238_c0_g1_i1:50-1024(+)